MGNFHIVEAGINVIGMDVLSNLGFNLNQAPKPPAGKHQPPISNRLTVHIWTDASVKALFNAKYPHIFTRVGRVKHHMVRTRFTLFVFTSR